MEFQKVMDRALEIRRLYEKKKSSFLALHGLAGKAFIREPIKR